MNGAAQDISMSCVVRCRYHAFVPVSTILRATVWLHSQTELQIVHNSCQTSSFPHTYLGLSLPWAQGGTSAAAQRVCSDVWGCGNGAEVWSSSRSTMAADARKLLTCGEVVKMQPTRLIEVFWILMCWGLALPMLAPFAISVRKVCGNK